MTAAMAMATPDKLAMAFQGNGFGGVSRLPLISACSATRCASASFVRLRSASWPALNSAGLISAMTALLVDAPVAATPSVSMAPEDEANSAKPAKNSYAT